MTAEEFQELASRCTLLHGELVRLGFVSSGRLMHEVVKQLGWERANQLDGKSPIDGAGTVAVSGPLVEGETVVTVWSRTQKRRIKKVV